MDKQTLIYILDIMLYEATQEQKDLVVNSHLDINSKVEALDQAIGFIMDNMENKNV